MTRAEIGAIIVATMNEKGLTLPAACEATGVSRMTLHSLRQGSGNPTLASLMVVAEFLELKIEVKR